MAFNKGSPLNEIADLVLPAALKAPCPTVSRAGYSPAMTRVPLKRSKADFSMAFNKGRPLNEIADSVLPAELKANFPTVSRAGYSPVIARVPEEKKKGTRLDCLQRRQATK